MSQVRREPQAAGRCSWSGDHRCHVVNISDHDREPFTRTAFGKKLGNGVLARRNRPGDRYECGHKASVAQLGQHWLTDLRLTSLSPQGRLAGHGDERAACVVPLVHDAQVGRRGGVQHRVRAQVSPREDRAAAAIGVLEPRG